MVDEDLRAPAPPPTIAAFEIEAAGEDEDLHAAWGPDVCSFLRPVMLASLAYSFNLASLLIECGTVKISSSTNDGKEIQAGVFSYKTVGFDYTTGGESECFVGVCHSYNEIAEVFEFEYEEGSWTMLSRITITLPILGPLATMLNFGLLDFFQRHPIVAKLFGLVYITCAILDGIGLKFMMESFICTNNPLVQYMEAATPTIADEFQNNCTMSTGMRLGISGVVFWSLAGLTSFFSGGNCRLIFKL